MATYKLISHRMNKSERTIELRNSKTLGDAMRLTQSISNLASTEYADLVCTIQHGDAAGSTRTLRYTNGSSRWLPLQQKEAIKTIVLTAQQKEDLYKIVYNVWWKAPVGSPEGSKAGDLMNMLR